MPPTDGKDSLTEFRYVVLRPDPNAAKISQRKQGTVRALASDGVEAGFVTFGLDSDGRCVSVTMVETFEPYRRRGCATGMVQALAAAYPESEIVDGGGSNSVEGNLLYASLQALRNS